MSKESETHSVDSNYSLEKQLHGRFHLYTLNDGKFLTGCTGLVLRSSYSGSREAALDSENEH